MRGFYFITDRGLSTKDDVAAAEDAVAAGAKVVQYREKQLSHEEKVSVAGKIKKVCAGKALFIINNDVDVALEVDADGVHLGQDDMPVSEAREILGDDKIIGVTVHDVAEAVEAEEGGADYVGASPIYSTSTKPDAGEPSGLKLICDVKEAVDIPVAAIGGINESNIDEVVAAGADMACAISATVAKKDIQEAVRFFVGKWI